MDESTMEVIREAMGKLRGDLNAARDAANGFSAELESAKSRGEDLAFQLEQVEGEKSNITKEILELRDIVDELQREKRQFGDVFRGELRDILS